MIAEDKRPLGGGGGHTLKKLKKAEKEIKRCLRKALVSHAPSALSICT